MLESRVALSVHAEGCVILTLDQPVASLIAVFAPGLYGERDVRVANVLGGSRLVAVLDHIDDEFRLVEAPYDECLEEVELGVVSETSATQYGRYTRGPQAPCY